MAAYAVKAQVQRMRPKAKVAQREVWQPIRQSGIDIQPVVRRIWLDAKHGLHQRKAGTRSPGLRHVGAEILHGKTARCAGNARIQFRQLVQQEMARGGLMSCAIVLTSLNQAVTLETKRCKAVVMRPDRAVLIGVRVVGWVVR